MSHACAVRPGWNPLTIALMVVGFIVAWPLGLAVIAYILWGDRFPDMIRDIKGQFNASGSRRRQRHERRHWHGHTGNVAFDEYREQELNRLEEERRKLDEMRAEFDTFLKNLRRAKDQAEFDRFMSERNRATGEASSA